MTSALQNRHLIPIGIESVGFECIYLNSYILQCIYWEEKGQKIERFVCTLAECERERVRCNLYSNRWLFENKRNDVIRFYSVVHHRSLKVAGEMVIDLEL